MPQEVRIVQAANPEGLQQQINDLLREGWKLIEGEGVRLAIKPLKANVMFSSGDGEMWYTTLVRNVRGEAGVS